MTAIRMKAYTYIEKGRFGMLDKPKPEILDPKDAIVRVTLSSICSSDLHIKHGSVPRAVPGITVGHEMVGVVEQIGSEVSTVKPGDRVTVNVETFCGECFFCKRGFVNNCTDPDGGWALGCRIDGGQTEYVRVPHADQGLNRIPDGVSDRQALFVGDVLATGFWAARISEIKDDDTVLIIGGGPTGICTLLCVMLKNPKKIILCEKSPSRQEFIRKNYPSVEVVAPEECLLVAKSLERGGADIVLEVGVEAQVRHTHLLGIHSRNQVLNLGDVALWTANHNDKLELLSRVGHKGVWGTPLRLVGAMWTALVDGEGVGHITHHIGHRHTLLNGELGILGGEDVAEVVDNLLICKPLCR